MKRISILVGMLLAGSIVSSAQWQYVNPAALPAGVGGSLLQTSVVGRTGGNNLYSNTWLYGTAASNDWTTTKLIDGISIDGSFQTPTTSRSWWSRDANNNIQSWGDQGNTYLTINKGNVGIGTAIPRGKFDVDGPGDIYLSDDLNAGTGQSIYLPGHIYLAPYGGTNWTFLQARRADNSGSTNLMLRTFNAGALVDAMSLLSNGNIGIGTSTPSAKLDIFGGNANTTNLTLSANYADKYRWRLKTTDRGNAIDMDFTSSDGADTEEAVLKLSRSNSTRPEFQLYNNTIVANDGNVGIGTANPTQKLTVNGTIYSKEVKVDLSVPGPDYVFEETYNLPSLTDTENYIKQNKHLPEVPSACEMEENGINLSEMNMLLLKKVEELTLYVIELKKITMAQQEEINSLKNK